MTANITDTHESLGDLNIIPDVLPTPEELVFRDDTVKVTITLSRSSVEFFKRDAKKHHTQYQKMIRRLLDVSTQKHQQPLTKRCTGRGTQHRAGELSRSAVDRRSEIWLQQRNKLPRLYRTNLRIAPMMKSFVSWHGPG
jgi:predicted DNA binding CopG/RHH family protein